MSDIIESYQQEQEIRVPAEASIAFAKVVTISANGIQVRFDGEDADSSKLFPCNAGIAFEVGQRVLMQKVNGQYIVMMPVAMTPAQPPQPEDWFRGTVKEDSVTTGTISAGSSKYFTTTIRDMKFLTGAVSNNASLIVNAEQDEDGTTVALRVFNVGSSSVAGNIYISYVA